jgi:hypothetical protein
MVMTEWMREVKKALETIPKDTPNRLRTAMKKAKLTYKKGSSSSLSHHASSASRSMKKSHKRRHGRSSKSRKGMRKSGRSRKHHRGGAMSNLSPANYEGGEGVGTSGVGVQMRAVSAST